MASPQDLASLADVKAWLGIAVTTSDPILGTLITAASRAILGYINRTILPWTVTEIRDGTGTQRMVLREWPVNAISALSVDGAPVAASPNPPFGAGYIFEAAEPGQAGAPQRLLLTTAYFCPGFSNVSIIYSAGYLVAGEAGVIPGGPGPYKITVAAPYGAWGADQGVTYANGTPLIPVPGTPAAGQYSVALGAYTFAAADAGAAVLISYGYTPADLAEACIQTVGEWFRLRDRIGVQSKSLAGQETITYSQRDLSAPVKMMCNPYMRNVPV